MQCIKGQDAAGLQQALDAGADEMLESTGPAGLTPLGVWCLLCAIYENQLSFKLERPLQATYVAFRTGRHNGVCSTTQLHCHNGCS